MSQKARVRRSRAGGSTGRRPDVSSRPLLIGGMHRSGTSLTASLFAAAGVDLGPELLPANHSNAMGHFEDMGFFRFHRHVLHSCGLGGEGYVAGQRVSVPVTFEEEARELLAARVRSGVAWGWKEPRTTLFLDFWQERLPDARHLFVFRRPWEVVDSLFRRGDDAFVRNPAFALAVWTHYNRLILDFVRRHPTNCLVFEISQVIADPDGVCAAVRSRLGVPVGIPARCYREELFSVDRGSAHETIVRSASPEAWRTYLELRELAGVGEPAAVRRDPSPGTCAIIEWCRAVRAEAQARESGFRVEQEAQARARLETQLRAAQEAQSQLLAEQEAQTQLRAEQEAQTQVRAEQEAQARSRAEQEARRDAERKALQRPMAVIKRGLRQIPAAVLRPCAVLGTLIRRGRRPESPANEPPLQVFPRLDQPPPAEHAA